MSVTQVIEAVSVLIELLAVAVIVVPFFSARLVPRRPGRAASTALPGVPAVQNPTG